MARRLLLLSLISFFLGMPKSPDSPLPGEFGDREIWARLNLHFNLLEEVLNPTNCSESSVKFLGCIKTLNFLLSQGDKTTRLTTAEWLQKDGDPEEKSADLKLEKDLGFFKIVSRSNLQNEPSSRDLVGEYEILRASQKNRENYWISFFKTQLSRSPLPIKEVEQWATLHHAKTHDLSSVIGEAYTVYLSSAEDAHGWIEPSESFELSRFKSEDEYFGTGVAFVKIRSKLAVKSLMREGAAFKSGLRVNDIVLSVNGQDPRDLSLDEIDKFLEKNKTKSLSLKIKRGQDSKDFLIHPTNVKMENVTFRSIETLIRGLPVAIGLIKISSFMKDGVCSQVHEALSQLTQTDKVKGLILDLRNNGGGLIDEAVCIGGLFLGPNQEVVSVHGFDQNITKLMSRVDLATDLPLITLINRNSASASEILAGALQDHGRSILVGERSFGKGTIQNVGPWEGHPGLHRAQTVARFYLPGNTGKAPHTNQIYGIYPEIEAFEVPTPKAGDKFAFREADYSPIVLQEEGPEATRPSALTEIKYRRCTSDFRFATSRYQLSLASNSALEDYPLLVAEDALSCDIKPSQQVASRLSH